MARRKSKKNKRSKKRRSTMGKNQIVVNIPFSVEDNNHTETIIYDIANKEKDIDIELLEEISTIPRTGPNSRGNLLAKLMVTCALEKDETADSVTYIRQLKEMISILNLDKNMLEKKLEERNQFRIKRLFKLKRLDLFQGYFHHNSELTNKITNIINDTGGLVVDLHIIESLRSYENLLGERIIDLYQDYKKSANIKGRETIRDSFFKRYNS